MVQKAQSCQDQRYGMSIVRLHIQTQPLFLLFFTQASNPQSCCITSAQNWKYWRWPCWTLCASRTLLGHTQTHKVSLPSTESYLPCAVFFSALVTECVSSFHSAWSSIIFNHPASECRTLPKTPYLHSDVIGLCGTVFNIGALCIQSGGGVLLLWVLSPHQTEPQWIQSLYVYVCM